MEPELLKALGERIKEDEERYVPNEERRKLFERTVGDIKCLVDKSNVKVWCTVDDPYKGMGVITLCGSTLWLRSAKTFAECISQADNVDIYSLSDGTVKIDITFYGL